MRVKIFCLPMVYEIFVMTTRDDLMLFLLLVSECKVVWVKHEIVGSPDLPFFRVLGRSFRLRLRIPLADLGTPISRLALSKAVRLSEAENSTNTTVSLAIAFKESWIWV